jgi:tetratricopeptide (TPR) repeat protein
VREVAQIGAALGRQFSHELIGAVAPMPRPQLEAGLAQLVGAELIYRRGTPPDAEYAFKHALVQDAAYSTLLRGRRQQLHARIVATIEERFPEIVAAQPALLAHHCTEADLTEKAIEYWSAAGRQAWRRWTAAEACALLRRGLALVSTLPDGDRRRETELDLQIALGLALTASLGSAAPELDEVHSRARELASMLNRPRELLFALWGQYRDHWARGDLKQAGRLAVQLRELGETTGDVLMQVLGCDACALTCYFFGEFTAGRAHMEKAFALYDPAHRSSYTELLSQDVQVQLWVHSNWLLARLGYLDQALIQRDAALEEARRLSHPPTMAIALACAFWTGSLVRFAPRSLLQYADQLLALASEHRLALIRALALIYRGRCLAMLGRSDEGIPLLTAGLASGEELGFMSTRGYYLALLGDAYRKAGQWQAALDHVTEARRLAETRDQCDKAETVRLSADVMLAMGDRIGAEAGYREAITIAHQQNAKLWELCAGISLARLWRDQGKLMEARALLAPVYGWFTEGFGTPVLQEAKALLGELDRN